MYRRGAARILAVGICDAVGPSEFAMLWGRRNLGCRNWCCRLDLDLTKGTHLTHEQGSEYRNSHTRSGFLMHAHAHAQTIIFSKALTFLSSAICIWQICSGSKWGKPQLATQVGKTTTRHTKQYDLPHPQCASAHPIERGHLGAPIWAELRPCEVGSDV